MKCKKCSHEAIKYGKQKNGAQRYYCNVCKQTFQAEYDYRAYDSNTNHAIIILLKEGCGIRSISRILGISPTTVMKRILLIASNIKKPTIRMGQAHEMDELITYIGNKHTRYCVAYAIDRNTREVIDFNVGRRNKGTLRTVVNGLVLSRSRQIRTDKLNLYQGLIPKELHHIKNRGINRIERYNLTLRTHLKRLNRRTIAYSKSFRMLVATLKIYFWSPINSYL